MDEKKRFDLVLRMGETLLANGGEIFRTSELMSTAAEKFGLEQFHTFIIANGIFASSLVDGRMYSCHIKYIPLHSICLDRVEALNDLSRQIGAGVLSAEAAEGELDRICALPMAPPWARILASGVGGGTFCVLFGGSLLDGWFSFLAGLLLYCFFEASDARFPLKKVMKNLLGSALVTLFCCAVYRLGWGSLDHMVIGAIFPLVPGVQLVTSVRNFMENDYLAGLIRLTDAILVAGCIAVGVGSVMIGWSTLLGGILL